MKHVDYLSTTEKYDSQLKPQKQQRIQFVTLSTSITSSLLNRASTCTALSVYKMCGSCPTFPPNPPSEQHTLHKIRNYPYQKCIKNENCNCESELSNNLTGAHNSWSMKQPRQHLRCQAFREDQGQSIPSRLHSSSDAPLPQIQNYLSSGNRRHPDF